MRPRATNAALKDARDETAILSTFWGNPLIHGGEPQPQVPTQMECWREMTNWVLRHGPVVIINEEARHITWDPRSCMHEALEEIGRLAALEDDWNDEGAPAIDRDSILRAQKFAQWLVRVAAARGLSGDCAPAVFPTIDGGVQLYWMTNSHQVALTFHPGQNNIDVMEKVVGAQASHQAVSEDEASAKALEAILEAA